VNIRNIIRITHLWLGLLSGLIVFVVSISGCMYVFVEEIEGITKKEYFFVEAGHEEKLSIAKLKGIAEEYLGEKVRAAAIYADPERSIIFGSSGASGSELRIYLNPYSGQVLKVENMEEDFFSLVAEFHYSLLLGDVGSKIISYAVLIFVILLITGIVLWWPKKKRKRSAAFTIKWNAKWRRKNYDLHSVLGFYASWIAIILAITGLSWSFEWVENGIYRLAAGEAKVDKEIKSDPTQANSVYPADQALSYTMENYPYGISYWVFFPADSIRPIYIYAYYKPDDLRARDSFYVRFDQYSGEVLEESVPGKRNAGEQFEAMKYDIHVGAIFGFAGKLLVFFTSLIIASLPVTGFLFWWGKRKKKKKKRGINNVKSRREEKEEFDPAVVS
jgi:uncharacterized iron-regulated membrane protein